MSESPLPSWWIKWSRWEFWPFAVLYFPVWFYYIWLSIKRGSLFFFTSSNPSIEFGGMMGEKKSDIYNLIPEKFLPQTKLFNKNQEQDAVAYAKKVGFPLIAKPDIGERGTWVEKISDETALLNYINLCPVPFLIQELVDYPIELGVFYVKYPGSTKGKVSSIVKKEFLKVVGDGHSSVKKLLENNPRARIQVDFSHSRLKYVLDMIPEPAQTMEIESIGNHCRGTQFLNLNSAINEKLNAAFDTLSNQIQEFHFGRFDLRCRSIDDLENLEYFKILELNGAGAEPGHIYQPGYNLIQAYKDILWHLNTLAEISEQNKERGYSYWPFWKGMKKIITTRKYNRILNAS